MKKHFLPIALLICGLFGTISCDSNSPDPNDPNGTGGGGQTIEGVEITITDPSYIGNNVKFRATITVLGNNELVRENVTFENREVPPFGITWIPVDGDRLPQPFNNYADTANLTYSNNGKTLVFTASFKTETNRKVARAYVAVRETGSNDIKFAFSEVKYTEAQGGGEGGEDNVSMSSTQVTLTSQTSAELKAWILGLREQDLNKYTGAAECGFCWNANAGGAPTISNNKIICPLSSIRFDGNGGYYTNVLEGFNPYDRIVVRAYATYEGGTMYGEETEFWGKDYSGGGDTHNNSLSNFTVTIRQGTNVFDFSVNFNCDDEPNEAGICYSTIQNPTIENQTVILFANGQSTENITNMTNNNGIGNISGYVGPLPNGTYYVKAYLKYANETVYSNEQQVVLNSGQ